VQAGILIGKAELIAKMNRNPMYRALRPDKIALAMAEETVFAYLKKREMELLPLWQKLTLPLQVLEKRAAQIRDALGDTNLKINIVKSEATPGGGSMPGGSLESIALEIRPDDKLNSFNRRLLDSEPPLIGYIENDRLMLDLRSIDESEDDEVIRILREAC
jgi:L-seryl-tRNA(Ser) seleniumtransferase